MTHDSSLWPSTLNEVVLSPLEGLFGFQRKGEKETKGVIENTRERRRGERVWRASTKRSPLSRTGLDMSIFSAVLWPNYSQFWNRGRSSTSGSAEELRVRQVMTGGGRKICACSRNEDKRRWCARFMKPHSTSIAHVLDAHQGLAQEYITPNTNDSPLTFRSQDQYSVKIVFLIGPAAYNSDL